MATSNGAADPAASSAATISHCLFDVDGLLLDTETAYTDAQRQVLEEIEPGLGAAFTWELKSKMMGRTSLAAGQVLIDALDLQNKHGVDAAEFVRRREEVLVKLFPRTRAMPGAARLVAHLRASGVPAAVATSSHRAHFELKSKNHGGIFENFGHVVTGCSVSKGKPHPEIFELAASKFDPPPASPANVLVFEDAPVGVEAALAAGMRCVFVPDERTPKGEAHSRACAVLGSLEEFDPSAWGLPAWKS